MAKVAGSLWVEGNDLHYIDRYEREWYMPGYVSKAAPAGATPGSIWIDSGTQYLMYVNEAGTLIMYPYPYGDAVSPNTAHTGSTWIEDRDNQIHWVGVDHSAGYRWNVRAHQDVAPTAGHTDAHQDAIHTDIPHTNIAHTDVHSDYRHENWHNDVPHYDSHTDYHDDYHADEHGDSHGDMHDDYHVDHWDGSLYQDYRPSGPSGHVDIHHGDSHNDQHWNSHQNAPHQDSGHQDYHQDFWDGVAHQDVPHTDTAHNDIAHTDAHQDAHVDTPHTDQPVYLGP